MAPSSPRREEKKRKTPPPHPPEAELPKRKSVLFQRTWPPGDEVRILEALVAHRRAHGGSLPTAAALFAALDGRLERKGVGARELKEKQRSFKRRYDRDAKKTSPPADEHERRLYILSREVWADDSPPKSPRIAQPESLAPPKPHAAEATEDATQVKSAGNPTKPRTLDEMRELYPYLVDEAMVLLDPPTLQKLLPSIHDNGARALDKKIKKARKQLTKAITESARMKNMETPTVFLFQSTKLQLEKPTVDKKDGEGICDQRRWAQMEREIVELRQILMASQSQGNKYEYAESGPRSVIAENEISSNMVQKEIKVPNGLPYGKNEVVTSKYKYEGILPRNVPHDNLKLQRLVMPPFNTFHGRTRKIDAQSQIQRNVGGKEVVLLSVLRPHIPVGKAILQNSSRSTIVDGVKLGTQFCKVFLSEVLQRDAELFNQYGEKLKMSDALKCFIAWPRVLIQDNAIRNTAPHRPSHQALTGCYILEVCTQ
ncbi:unnamed protein product [Urochloa decumbens]|uniref:Transposase Tnp1/En/Spm-like domain-containing protein n=1 Tax=Urochloa decumbens TaxID=240449 RepID=A0ABC9D8U2_9POAL